MDIASRRYGDVVVAAPVGRIDHANADSLTAALAPLLESSGGATLLLDFSRVDYISSVGLRVLMMAAKRCARRSASSRVAAPQPIVREIFEISRFNHVLDLSPSVRAGARTRCRAPALAAYDAAGLAESDVKRVRFWGTRGSLPVALTADRRARASSSRRCAARRDGRSPATRDIDAYVDGLAFDVARHVRRALVVRRDRHRRPGLRALRSRQRRAAVRPGRARAARRRRRRPTTSSCRTCTGTTSWACRSSRRPTSRATASSSTAAIRCSRRRCAASRSSRRFRSTSRRCASTIEFVRLEPGRQYDIAGMRVHAQAAAPRAATRTATASSSGGTHASSTRPIRSTRSPTRRRPTRFVEFFRDADLVIFDAMYSLADAISVKADWGHSSNIVGVELCQRADVEHLCLFHHEPASTTPRSPACWPTRAATRKSRATGAPLDGQRRLRRDGNRFVTDPGGAEAAPMRSRAAIRPSGFALLLALDAR